MNPLIAIGIVFGLIGIVGLIYGYIVPHMEKYRSMEDSIQMHNETILYKDGGTSLYFPPWWNKIRDGKAFNYHLKSFDGGKNWYAVDKEKLFNEIIILGLVEHIYPGLMDHLDGMDNLTDHVRGNGSLDLTKKEDVEVLTNAGFTVKTK